MPYGRHENKGYTPLLGLEDSIPGCQLSECHINFVFYEGVLPTGKGGELPTMNHTSFFEPIW